LQANRKLYAKIHKITITQIHKYYIDKAAANGIKDPKPGSNQRQLKVERYLIVLMPQKQRLMPRQVRLGIKKSQK
jgi:hypothetical protein